MKWFLVAILLAALSTLIWFKRGDVRKEIDFRRAQQAREASVTSLNVEQLRNLLEQDDVEVRRMAAIRLAHANDATGRGALIASLYPQTIFATGTGNLQPIIVPGKSVRIGETIATLTAENILSPINGKVLRYYQSDEGSFKPGQRVAAILPKQDTVKDVIKAIALIGKASDAEELEEFAKSYPKFAAEVVSASQTIRARRK